MSNLDSKNIVPVKTGESLPTDPTTTAQGKVNRRKIWIICGIVALLGIFLALFLTFGHPGSAMASVFSSPLNIHINIPQTVKVGENFFINVRIQNPSSSNITVSEIGLPINFMNGAEVVGSQPPYNENTTSGDNINYKYNIVVPPGGTTVVYFELIARNAGTYRGQIPVYERVNGVFTRVQLNITG